MYPKKVAGQESVGSNICRYFLQSEIHAMESLTKNTERVVSILPHARVEKRELIEMFPYCKTHDT